MLLRASSPFVHAAPQHEATGRGPGDRAGGLGDGVRRGAGGAAAVAGTRRRPVRVAVHARGGAGQLRAPDCSRPLTLGLHEHGLLYSSQTGVGIDKDIAEEMARRSGCKLDVDGDAALAHLAAGRDRARSTSRCRASPTRSATSSRASPGTSRTSTTCWCARMPGVRSIEEFRRDATASSWATDAQRALRPGRERALSTAWSRISAPPTPLRLSSRCTRSCSRTTSRR